MTGRTIEAAARFAVQVEAGQVRLVLHVETGNNGSSYEDDLFDDGVIYH